MKFQTAFILFGIASVLCFDHNDHHVVDDYVGLHADNLLNRLKHVTSEVSELQEHVKELRNLSERTRITQKLSALAFYQDFVVNTQLRDWSWMCEEFLTEDVNMTVYTTNATFSFITSEYSTMSAINFVGCQNVTKFYNATVSGMFAFIYHPYVNPWVELFEDGTANTLVSGMNNAVIRKETGPEAFWSFNYYTFGWKKTEKGWKIHRFIHLSSFTVPYVGEAWSHIPVPFTNMYDLILADYPLLGKHFKERMDAQRKQATTQG